MLLLSRRTQSGLRTILFMLACAAPAAAQCPAKTTIADTIYNADGSLASGRVTVRWQTFRIGTCQVIAGETSVIVTAGALSFLLFPSDAALPAGTSYRVTFALRSGQVTTEYWVVPTSSSPVALAAVRSSTVPVPNVMFSQSQVTNLSADLNRKVELPAPCPAGKFLQSSGSASPPQVDCVDPPAGGSGGGAEHSVNGTLLSSSSPVNFQDSGSIAFTNPSAGNIEAALKDSAVTAAKLAASSPSGAQLSGVGDANIAAGALSANRISGTAVVQARAVNTSSPLTGGGDLSADRTIACQTASDSQAGCLSSADWTTFNNKQNALGFTPENSANKGAANGYASLNASSKVVQDPASAQTTAAASKIPLADGAGKIADGWLSSNVSLLGSAIEDGELAGNYSGTGSCTNQFVRAVNDNAAPTCATVTSADVDSSVRTGTVAIANGGTGATDAATARTNLGTGTVWTNMPITTVGASTTTYTAPNGALNFNATEGNRQIIATRTGTLKRLYVRISTSQPSTGSLVATVRVNGSNTSIVVTIAASATAAVYSDTSNTAAVVAGDLVSIRFVNNATSNSASVQSIALEIE